MIRFVVWRKMLFAMVVCCAAQHSPAADNFNSVFITDDSLMKAVQNLRKTLLDPKTSLMFEDGTAVQNCAEYSNLVVSKNPSESIRDAEIRSEYLICESVRLISNEPYLLKKGELPSNLTQLIFEGLDLRSFSSSLRNRADNQKYTFKSLLPNSRININRTSIEVETDDQLFSLKIVAVISGVENAKDINANRGNDLVVWVGDEMKNGNYKSYRTLIVRPSDTTPRGRYTAFLYPLH